MSSPRDIRYADVAQYVGLSLFRDPARGSSKVNVRRPTQNRENVVEPNKSGPPLRTQEDVQEAAHAVVPVVALGACHPDRIRSQIEWLKAEHKAEKEQLKRLEASLSDSLLVEKKAHRRAQKNQEMHSFHQRRSHEVEEMICKLKEELTAQELSVRPVSNVVTKLPHARSASRSDQILQGGRTPQTHSLQTQGSAISDAARPSTEGLHEAYRSRGALASAGKQAPVAGNQTSTSRTPEGGSSGSRQGRVAQNPQGEAPAALSASVAAHGALVPGEDPPLAPVNDITLKDYFEAADAAERFVTKSTGSKDSPQKSKLQVSSQNSASSTRQLSGKFHEPGRAPTGATESSFWLSSATLAQKKDILREELKDTCGSHQAAFRRLDTNGNGAISLSEFADGVSGLGVDWKKITGLRTSRELFKAFCADQDGRADGVITFKKLFPDFTTEEPARVTTPEFWKQWCRQNQDIEMPLRSPKWQPANAEEELDILFGAAKSSEEGTQVRKWMSGTIRRLKNRGKSDARCREVVARHLPRGTGPKDREDVQTFSKAEVKACRKAYIDEVNDPVRNIQKVVYAMREQRRTLHESRQKLWAATVQPLLMKQLEEERKLAATNLAASFGFHASGKATTNLKDLSQKCGIAEEELEELSAVFSKSTDDSSEELVRAGFSKLMKALFTSRALSEQELDIWWDQIQKHAAVLPAGATAEADAPGSHETNAQVELPIQVMKCNFDQFVEWYVTSEAFG